MKTLAIAALLGSLVSFNAFATGTKECAENVQSDAGVRTVCVSDVGTPQERLYVTTDWAVQTFQVSETKGVNAGINPAYQAEISKYYLLIPKTTVAVLAEAQKNYVSGKLSRIKGAIGGISKFTATFKGN